VIDQFVRHCLDVLDTLFNVSLMNDILGIYNVNIIISIIILTLYFSIEKCLRYTEVDVHFTNRTVF